MKRQFAVLGLGKFGFSIAKTLSNAGYEVIAVDRNEDIVQEIADIVTYALKADVTEPGVLKNIGIRNVDAVVVAISENMESSVMATILAKEAGAPYVLSKAGTELHGQILKKIGADEIIYPEQAMGARTAKKLISGSFLDLYELSKSFSMVEVIMPADWAGKSLKELNLRKKGINVIGMIQEDSIELNIDPDMPLPANETLLIVAKNDILSKIV
ncbi:MAG: TrkA family potassium uptake protein [Lachnospiraceae bacterium]|nr:TrkA family potassium uptake protein [Lachnospiraceae bacterium]